MKKVFLCVLLLGVVVGLIVAYMWRLRTEAMTSSRVVFVTFGTKPRFTNSLDRIKKEAESMNMFDEIYQYTDDDLKSMPDFWRANGEFVETNARGYGYWIWKPYLIMKTMEKMAEGDVLVYCDCGTTLNPGKRERLVEYIEDCTKSTTGIYCFSLWYPEKQYTKTDLFDKLEMKTQDWLDSNQIMATDILVRKCPESQTLIEKWYRLCMQDNYHYVTDAPSKLVNDSVFVEHRHDQSIFSLLVKKTGGCHIGDGRETESATNNHEYPIYNSRIRE